MPKSHNRVLTPIALVVAIGLVAIQVLPSIANQLSSPGRKQEITVLTPETTTLDNSTQTLPQTSAPALSPTLNQAENSPKITYLVTASPSAPAQILMSDVFVVKIPSVLRVDPRATKTTFNSIALGGSDITIFCLSSTSLTFSISSNPNILIEGNGSTQLRIAGVSSDILNAITSGQGIVLHGSKEIANSAFSVKVGALTKVGLSEALCERAPVTKEVFLAPIGIDLNTVKSSINMEKK